MHCLLQKTPPIFVAPSRPVMKEKSAEAALSIFFPSHAHLTIFPFFFFPRTRAVTQKPYIGACYFPLEGLFLSKLRAVCEAKDKKK